MTIHRAMKLAFSFLLVLCCAILIVGQKPKSSNRSAGAALHALLDQDWQYQLQQYPEMASSLGDRRWNDRWTNNTLGAIDARQAHSAEVLAALTKIDRKRLTVPDQLNYDLFLRDLKIQIEEFKYNLHLLPLNQRGGVQTIDTFGDLLRFDTVKDYEDWIARLERLPVLIEQTANLMRSGMQQHIMWPKVVMQRVSSQIDGQLVGDPVTSGFYRPFLHFPAAIGQADRDRLTRLGQAAISTKVVPAYKEFQQFFNQEYLPACFDEVGAWKLPKGEELYAFEARKFTTTNLTPQQIFDRGRAEVTRIRAEMEQIKQQVGFNGTLQEFFQHLRTDSSFYYKTPEELLNAYRAICKRIDPNLIKLFKTLPRTPYGVTPIADSIAPDTTTAYYNSGAADGSRAGLFYVNLYKPEVRPKYEMMALSLHESVPGHHLQLSLAQEAGDVPEFRRYGDGYIAFVEGWGLYAESLGEEMGLYDDPYSKFGQLTYEMWRAVRLVVDTGMHFFKWDRQKAIDFFRANAAKTDQDIFNEIDRYITDPGQALAYKIGELKLKELRARAHDRLGDKFDVREFHDVVLREGSLPLDILEQHVDSWIDLKLHAK